MSEYRFEKHQAEASLLLSTGCTRRGRFFVVSSLSTHPGAERVGDLLNEGGGFFPFQHDNGSTGQYNRAHVVLVNLPAGVHEEQSEPGYTVALPREVTLTLSTGTTVEGTIFISGPQGRERLSDFIRHAKHFWYVVTPRGTAIVNSAHVVAIVERGGV